LIDLRDGVLGGNRWIASTRNDRISSLPDKRGGAVAAVRVPSGLNMPVIIGVVKVDDERLVQRVTGIQAGVPKQVFLYTVG